MLKTEERNPKSTHIDKMSTLDMVKLMSEENYVAVKAVEDAAESIAEAVDAIVLSMNGGGRLFYIGAGTSGRLGVLDASECPPTFGVSPELVSGIIAGGYDCLVKASEGGEDSYENGILEGYTPLAKIKVKSTDVEFQFPKARPVDMDRFFDYNVVARIHYESITETIVINFTSKKGIEKSKRIMYSYDWKESDFKYNCSCGWNNYCWCCRVYA